MMKQIYGSIGRSLYKIRIEEKFALDPHAFENKVVVVTGGLGELGSAVSEILREQGAKVIVIGRKEIKHPIHDDILYIKWDISKELGILCEKIEECAKVFGRIDIWINNAGVISENDLKGSFWNISEEDYDLQFDVNFKAVFFLVRGIAEYFVKHRIHGIIFNVLSNDGILDTWKLYGLSKRMAIYFTRAISQELELYQVSIMGIAPGGIKTRMIKPVLNGESLRKNSVPNRRLAERYEVAHCISYMLLNKPIYRGKVLIFDGGDTLI